MLLPFAVPIFLEGGNLDYREKLCVGSRLIFKLNKIYLSNLRLDEEYSIFRSFVLNFNIFFIGVC